MFKKKFIFPVLAILAISLVGCGGNDNPGGGGGESEPPDTSDTTPEVTTYTVTFHSNGGSVVRKQTVEEGEKATRPTNPTKGGNEFVDWYTESTLENVYDFNTPVVSNLNLYAKWQLSTARVLVSELQYYSTDDTGSELAMFNTPGTLFHNSLGWGGEGLVGNMSWRTIAIFDSQGRLAYGVHCPANGYGAPSEYSYVSHEHYGPQGVGYYENPAIVLGENYSTNGADYEIVVPEGGFAITGHTSGANAIYSAVTGSTDVISSDGADNQIAEERGRAFNKTHGEWSTRSFELDASNSLVKVYDLSTHVTFTGDYSGAFEGDASTGTYTREMKLSTNKKISFAYYNGLLSLPVTTAMYTFTGEYGDGTGLVVHPDDPNALLVTKAGVYTFNLNVNTNTFAIEREAISEFKITFIDVIGKVDNFMMVGKNEEFTLPTPTNVPSGYTFNNWIKGDKTVFSSGTFTGEEDVTLYACYTKDGKQVAYSGIMSGMSVDADSMAAVWSSDTYLRQYSPDNSVSGAGDSNWVGNGWRLYAAFDEEGRMTYGVLMPNNGYGGPDGYSYMCNDYYKASGVGYQVNPSIEILDGYGPWVPDGTDYRKFNIKVPEGGFGLSCHGTEMSKLLNLVTNNAFPNFDGTDATMNETCGVCNSSATLVNNTFSYDSLTNTFYSSLY